MKSWKWYARQLRENPPFRLDESESYSWIKSHKKRKKFIKADSKAARHARDFEKENGFAFEDCWNLDVAIAKFLYPRLAYLRDNHKGVPAIIDSKFKTIEESDKEWTRILNRMTKGFYIYATKEGYDFTDSENNLIKEAKELFIEYFSRLWI